jgi:hypothetical protein
MPPQNPTNNLPWPRRRFLRLLVALSSVVPASVLLAVPGGKSTRRISIKALGPYLDTLIPEDQTPSATQLGVDKSLLAVSRANSRFARLIALGCEWLDKQARDQGFADFSALDETAQQAIVAAAEGSPARSLPRSFFNSTRKMVFRYYYAHPESWRSLGYAGPPQPFGFLDFAQPPKAPS